MSPVQMFKALFVGIFCLSGVMLNSVVADTRAFTVAMLIPGDINDGGFMEAGFDGLMAIDETLAAQTFFIANVESDVDTLAGALRRLAEADPDLVIAHGAQSAYAAMRVAAEYSNIRFVVTQGDVIADNLSSYRVHQEESATNAMRKHGVKQFGNVGSWVTIDPEVLVGAAITDVSAAVLAAALDLADGSWEGNQIVQIALDDINAVGLTLGSDVSDAIRAQIEGLQDSTFDSEIDVLFNYAGQQFDAMLTRQIDAKMLVFD